VVKVVVLNDLYRTNIYDPWSVAGHIVRLNIDNRLRAGDQTLIGDLARMRLGGKERILLSFATKYAGWHHQIISNCSTSTSKKCSGDIREHFDSLISNGMSCVSTLVSS